jgi:serine/threonine-protein kinase
MVLPIPVGTILRQRYVIQQVLGQGGFGRTYLALDQERFDEPCVIKEFLVLYQDEALIKKSKSLFQREASILYQIQHPQIPRFWAAFEDEQRLFLVQDFVAGQTYRRLLSDRKQQKQTFSEAEVLHFLQYMLPVLTYIHDRDIIHRDITPENIILQTPETTQFSTTESLPESGLPVLIDFGAVKEATSHWPLMSTATRVGKVGYAPPEQLQTGKVYPNSDLYALAATCLTLLTAREPQTLLDSQTLTWRWQPYATIGEELGGILQKMLSVYPGDRYQSSREVLAELQPLLESSLESTLLPPSSRAVKGPKIDSRVSSAVKKPVQSVTLGAPSSRSNFSSSELKLRNQLQPSRRTFKTSVQLGIAAMSLVALGVAVPVIWDAWKGNSGSNDVWVSGTKLSESEASKFLESQGIDSSRLALRPSNEASPGSGDDANPSKNGRPPQLIQFPPGKISTVLRGELQNNDLQPYILKGAQGQIMTATLEGEGVTMNLLRSNQEGIDGAAYQTRNWTGQLPIDDQYLIQVAGSGSYSLDVAITPLSRPTQEQTQRVSFARGMSGTTVTGQISPKQIRRYLLRAKQGQILALKVLQGTINVSTIAPNGQRIGGSSTVSKNWQGDYVIEVSAVKPNDFILSFEIF